MNLTKTQASHATALATSLAATVTGLVTTSPNITKIGGALSAFLVGLAGLYRTPPTKTVGRSTVKTPKVPRPFIMADSVTPGNLPKGLTAYAGYVAGRYRNFTAVKALFPKAKTLAISPFAAVLARCLDIEKGCALPSEAGNWVTRAITAGTRIPILYCELSEVDAVIADLKLHGHRRTTVKWFIAHPGQGKHICGPTTCKQLAFDADATQYEWAPGYDLSYCRGDFLNV